MTARFQKIPLTALALCAALLLPAGCGSSDEGGVSSGSGQQSAQNVIGVAVAYKPESDYEGNLDQFVSAASSFGVRLTPELKHGGPYTVFAPTTGAFFKSMTTNQFERLAMPGGQKQMKEVVEYNVVPGDFTTTDLKDGQKLKTMQGGELTVRKDGDTVTLVGAVNEAKVVDADLDASNGVVHVTDTLLLPFALD